MPVESQIRLSNVTFVVVVNNVARVKQMSDQPKILDLVREWWKDHPELHKIKLENQRTRLGDFHYELKSDPPWGDDPAFGFQCTCCNVWWIIIRSGVMSWAYHKEGHPLHRTQEGHISDPKFFDKIEHALKVTYHPG